MRPRIANPRSGMSQDERDAPAAADGPRGAAPRYTPCRADCVQPEVPAAKKEIPLGADALRPARPFADTAATVIHCEVPPGPTHSISALGALRKVVASNRLGG
jgi:hypothetical protein